MKLHEVLLHNKLPKSAHLLRGPQFKIVDKIVGENYKKDNYSILEIGSGKNPVNIRHPHQRINCDIVDFSDYVKNFVCIKSKKLPFNNNYFDFVLLSSVVQIAGQNILKEASRVLKPGGILIFSIPGKPFLIKIFPLYIRKILYKKILRYFNKPKKLSYKIEKIILLSGNYKSFQIHPSPGIISSIFYELLLVLVVVLNRKYFPVHGRKFLPLFIFLNFIDRSLLFFTKKIQSQCPYGEKVVVYIKK